MTPVTIAAGEIESPLSAFSVPLKIDKLLHGSGPIEVEIGFGKGRYLLRRATEDPEVRFLGIEVASEYYRRVRERAVKRGLDNVCLVRGEALYLLSAVLPPGFASAVHVYFPDPWPKARHEGRRLFDVETVDLVLGLLAPRGVLFFATDFLDYGERVAQIVDSHPGVARREIEVAWDGIPRTNYEAKYVEEGRPIRRFEVERTARTRDGLVHPRAEARLRAARAGLAAGLHAGQGLRGEGS